MQITQDSIDRHINDFAMRSFRDIADGDYIAARLAIRNGLMPQFLWASQQAIEKYLKCILLLNRIPAREVSHDLNAALELTTRLPFPIDLRERSHKFLAEVARVGPYRYLDVSYHVIGIALVNLDVTIWDLRRYAQVLDVFGKQLPAEEERLLEQSWEELRESRNHPPQHFRLHRGTLEKIIDTRNHPARANLIWQNPCFGPRARPFVKAEDQFHMQNAPLYLFPEMLDELLRYVHVPRNVLAGYRLHLAKIKANPSQMP